MNSLKSENDMWARGARMVAAGVLGLALVGCGGKKLKTDFVDVTGTVTLDGEPLENAQVVFETEKGLSYARTDSNGFYRAEYSQTLNGVGRGPAKVRISTSVVFPDEDVSNLKRNPRSGDHEKEERVPSKYNTKSELKVEIAEGNGPFDFPLVTR